MRFTLYIFVILQLTVVAAAQSESPPVVREPLDMSQAAVIAARELYETEAWTSAAFSHYAAAWRWGDDRVFALPPIIARELYFGQARGSEFAAHASQRWLWAGFGQAIRSARRLGSVRNPDPALSLAREGWRLVYDGAVGEYKFRQHLLTALPGEEVERLAAGWAGDRLQIFQETNGDQIVWAWQQRWQSAEAAAEFAAGYRRLLNGRFGELPPNEHCWVAAMTRCAVRYSEFETRIVAGLDRQMAFILLAPRG